MLLVEPHADTRELYHLWLSQCGFKVAVATSGDHSVAVARLATPDVVVIEPMIERGGVSLIRALRTEPVCADAVIVVVTTQADRSSRHQAIEAGADAYVVKPCGVSQLADAIGSASSDRLRFLSPVTDRLEPSPARFRQALQRCQAIRERLVADAVSHPAVGPRVR